MRLLLIGLALTWAATAQAAARPQFEDYPATATYAGPSHRPILDTPAKMAYRTRLRAAAADRPNFAGQFVLTTWGCGTGCQQFAIVSPRTGRVFMPPFGTAGGETMYGPNEKWERIDWRPNSRLLIVNGKVTDDGKEPDAHHFYVFDGQELNYLAKEKGVPYVEPPASTVAAAPAPTSAAEPPPVAASELPAAVLGRWSSTYAECRNPAFGMVIIEKKKLQEHELECDFTKLEHVEDAWTIIADCETENDKFASRLQLTIDGDTLIKQYDKKAQSSLLRCP